MPETWDYDFISATTLAFGLSKGSLVPLCSVKTLLRVFSPVFCGHLSSAHTPAVPLLCHSADVPVNVIHSSRHPFPDANLPSWQVSLGLLLSSCRNSLCRPANSSWWSFTVFLQHLFCTYKSQHQVDPDIGFGFLPMGLLSMVSLVPYCLSCPSEGSSRPQGNGGCTGCQMSSQVLLPGQGLEIYSQFPLLSCQLCMWHLCHLRQRFLRFVHWVSRTAS